MTTDNHDLLEWHRNRKERGVLPLSGMPHYTKPHAWKVLRVRAGRTMVSTTCRRFAIGEHIRLGAELPRNVTFFDTEEAAIAAWE